MEWQHLYKSKVVSAQEAVSEIKRGNRVFIGTGCGEPQHLIKAMVTDLNLQDIMLYQMLSFTLSQFIDNESFNKRFSLKLFFTSRFMRKAAFEGKIDYIPAYRSRISDLFASQRIGLDTALVQVSPPDAFGYCSLGVSVDITRAGLEHAGKFEVGETPEECVIREVLEESGLSIQNPEILRLVGVYQFQG